MFTPKNVLLVHHTNNIIICKLDVCTKTASQKYKLIIKPVLKLDFIQKANSSVMELESNFKQLVCAYVHNSEVFNFQMSHQSDSIKKFLSAEIR